ncbi:MAG: Mur ligase family protein, partial [Fimbriimonadales bacterium]
MNWHGERVAVIGAGRSGRDSALALHQQGAWVELFDRSEQLEVSEISAKGIPVHLGRDVPPDITSRGEGWTRVVVSPGVRLDHAVFEWASRFGVPVWGEIELAYRLARAPIIAITGTNGKTTTTALTHHLLTGMGLEAHLCGNIAGSGQDKTLVQASLEASPSAYLVAEVSSFQLVHIEEFRPHIAVLTNIGEDHLDYHGSWEAYALAKANLFRNQTGEDWAI